MKILLRNQKTKETREVEQGVEYRLLPDEIVLGPTYYVEKEKDIEALSEEVAKNGILWGDVVANAAKIFGIKPCTSCEQRRQILNHIQRLGVKEAARQIMETLK